MADRFKKHKKESALKTFLSDKQSSLVKNPENLNFSFEDFCSKQKYASSFSDWQKEGLLSKTLETFTGYCSSPISYDDTGKFTLYNDFPRPHETLYTHPDHVTLDASWVRIHINGPAVVIGHVVKNTFYVVFLDKTHKFFLTKRNIEKFHGKKSTKPEMKAK